MQTLVPYFFFKPKTISQPYVYDFKTYVCDFYHKLLILKFRNNNYYFVIFVIKLEL